MHWTQWLWLSSGLLWGISAWMNWHEFWRWRRAADAYERKCREVEAECNAFLHEEHEA